MIELLKLKTKLTIFQIKSLLLAFVLCIIIVTISLYYFKSMGTKNMALNINKMSKQDKIYSYSVYSDFFYRISKYDNEGEKVDEFAKIVPLETSIGYDLKEEIPKIKFSTRKYDEKAMHLTDKSGAEVRSINKTLDKFSKKYSEMIVVQDQDYFNEASKSTQAMIKELYGNSNIKIPTKSIDEYYEKEIILPISNLEVKPYKLKEILKNKKSFKQTTKDKWYPNLIEWKFGEEDRIYLQYLGKAEKTNLDEYIKKRIDRKLVKNKIVIKTTKINKKKIRKFFFEIDDSKNKITSYSMDTNGYIYLLIFKANNTKSFDKYLFDYLKIAFGISFKDSMNFNNKYAEDFDKIQKAFNMYKKLINYQIKIDKNLEKKGLLKHFSLIKSYVPSNVVLDAQLEEYKEYFKEYPNKDSIIENIVEKEMILCVDKKMSGLFYDGKSLEKSCKNIKCVKKLVNENYPKCREKIFIDKLKEINE